MPLSVRLNKEDTELIKKYAELKGLSLSELVRQSVLERIEDEFDLTLYAKALATFHADPETYSLDEVERKLGLK